MGPRPSTLEEIDGGRSGDAPLVSEASAATAAADAFDFDQLEPPASQDEVDAAIAAARAEGYAAGRADGMAEVEARLAPVEELLRSLAGELTRVRDEAAERVERATVSLALQIAEQALSGALAVRPERVIDVVRGGLRRLVERERVTVLVNPADLELVRERIPELIGELGGIEHCEVQADRRVARGGTVVRTVDGDIDATIQTKLERAREVLESELAGGD